MLLEKVLSLHNNALEMKDQWFAKENIKSKACDSLFVYASEAGAPGVGNYSTEGAEWCLEFRVNFAVRSVGITGDLLFALRRESDIGKKSAL